MKQGYLLKRLDMKEFEFEQNLINRVVECNNINIQSKEHAKAMRINTKIRSAGDY